MLSLPPSVRVYLATEPVDLRKSIDGLAAIVRNQWHGELYAGHLFAFVSRRGDRIKVLFFDRGGFVVYYKRLEHGRFRLPTVEAARQSVELESAELAMLLAGFETARRRPRRWLPPPDGTATSSTLYTESVDPQLGLHDPHRPHA